jgi:flagella basal body P-ring formation protein FlgA
MKTYKITSIAISMIISLLMCTGAWAVTDVLFDKVQKAVKENLSRTISDKVELEELRIVKGAEYFGGSGGNMTIQNIYMDGYSGRNKVIYAVYLRDGSTSKTVNTVVEASYDVFADVFVTARALSRGDVLSQDDYYTVRQKMSRLPAGAITDRRDIDGTILKSSVSDGVILRSNYLLASAKVKRGQKVSVVVSGQNIEITSKGTLRNDVMVGEVANVMCDITKKEVSGILVSPTLVKVKI